MSPREMPSVAGVEHRFVDVPTGVRLHVAEAGPPDGDVVVLVHGWPQNWYCWRRVIPHLADAGRRVLVPDLRGFGWSDAPASSYVKTEFGDDLAGLLEALDVRDVQLVGHDWGGYSVFLAALASTRVRSVTAFSITTPWASGRPSPRGALSVLAYQPLIATPFVGAAVQRYTPFVTTLLRVSGGERVWTAADRAVYADQFREPERAEAASRVYRSFLTRELRRFRPTGRITVPCTLTVGRGDPVISPSLLAGADAGIDSLEVEWVDGGHFLPEERPAVVAERILGQAA